MEGNSIFNKVAEIKKSNTESQQVDKELMYSEVRREIETLSQAKEKYSNLLQEFKNKKEELLTNHTEYKQALNKVLPLFKDEENKNTLNSSDVFTVNDLQDKFADTGEIQTLSFEESQTKRNLDELRKMKERILEDLNIESSEPRNFNEVLNFLHGRIDSIDRQISERSVDTPEGRASWPIRYPMSIFHKENDFEKNIRENKEARVREIYHQLGDKIDAALLESVREFNELPEAKSEPVKMEDGYKEGRHVISRKSIEIEDNKIKFYLGGGYSSLMYEVAEGNQGKFYANCPREYKGLLPEKFIKIFNDKLGQVNQTFEMAVGGL